MLGSRPGALGPSAVLIALLLGTACSADDPQPEPSTKSMLAGAVGFGEGRDTAYGSHKVSEVVDPVSAADARAAGVRTKDAEKVVAAVVSECAREPAVLSRDGWSVLLTGRAPVAAAVQPAPAREGAPSIDGTRRVAAGACAYARVLFVVPSGAEVAGIHYRAPGARTATWRASVGTTGLP